MPCLCGRKVSDRLERSDFTKLICKGCKQCVHSKCYNVLTKVEYDFIKDDFTCQACSNKKKLNQPDQPITPKSVGQSSSELAEGDSSFVLCSVSAVSNVVGINAVTNNNNIPNEVNAAKKSADNIDIGMIAVTNNNKLNSEIVNAAVSNNNIFHKTAGDVLANKNEDLINTSGCEITTKMLFEQIMILKADNVELKKSVALLLEANNNLISKVESLECLRCPKSCDLTKGASVHKSSNLKAKPTEKSSFATTSSKNNSTQVNTEIVPNNNNTVMSSASNSRSFADAARLSNVNNLLPSLNTGADPTTFSPSPNIPEWTTVAGNRKKNKQIMIGTGAKGVIGVVSKFKWLHISSFTNTVSEEEVINVISHSSKISANNFVCFKLVKKDEDVSKLNFINFKLGIVPYYYDLILNPALWPACVNIRPFKFMGKKPAPTAGNGPDAISDSATLRGSFLEVTETVPRRVGASPPSD